MFEHARGALRSLFRDWYKVAIGAAVGVLAGGALVYGDGGDASLVHACILPSGGGAGANVRIVGENDACPAGSTPKHWSIQGPPGAQGQAATPDSVLNALKIPSTKPPGVGLSRKKLRKVRVKVSQTKTIQHVQGPNLQPIKDRILVCPASHPKVVTGGFTTTPPPGQNVYSVIGNSQIWTSAWRTTVVKYGQPSAWKLTVWATCKK